MWGRKRLGTVSTAIFNPLVGLKQGGYWQHFAKDLIVELIRGRFVEHYKWSRAVELDRYSQAESASVD